MLSISRLAGLGHSRNLIEFQLSYDGCLFCTIICSGVSVQNLMKGVASCLHDRVRLQSRGVLDMMNSLCTAGATPSVWPSAFDPDPLVGIRV